MFNRSSLMEQGFRLNLQFFAPDEGLPNGGAAAGTTSVEPTLNGIDQAGEQSEDGNQGVFTHVDPNTLSPELQSVYKNLQADYTRKTQEIAPLRKLAERYGGAEQVSQAFEQLNQVATTVNSLAQTDPEAAVNYLAEAMGISRKQAAKEVQSMQKDENPYASEDWFKAAVEEAKRQMMPEIETLKRDAQQRKTQEFMSEVERSAQLVLDKHPGIGITKDDIVAAGRKGRYAPDQMHAALIDAVGGIDKYNEYLAKKAITDYTNKIRQNNASTGTTLTTGGVPVSSTAQPAKSFGEAKQNALAMLKAIKNQ